MKLNSLLYSFFIWFLIAVLTGKITLVETVRCHIGYGQRGLRNSNEISWARDCVLTDYCFEAVTKDINRIKDLIDYPWVST